MWRPSRRLKRHCAKLDRYYARCRKVTNDHCSTPPHEKRYKWLVDHDYGM